MRMLAAAAMALTSLFAGAAQAEPVSDAAFRFSVTFPVQSGRETFADPEQSIRRAVEYEAWDDDAYFVATVAQFGPSDDWAWNDIGGVFRDARSECVTSNDVVQDRAISISGGLGAEVLSRRSSRLSSDQVYDLSRVVVRVNKMYCLRATYRDAEDAEAARRFVRSLSVY